MWKNVMQLHLKLLIKEEIKNSWLTTLRPASPNTAKIASPQKYMVLYPKILTLHFFAKIVKLKFQC